MTKTFTTSIDGSKLNVSYGHLTAVKIRSIDYITGIVIWNAVAGETIYPEVLGSNLDPKTLAESTVAATIRAEIDKLKAAAAELEKPKS
jgi:hypothetical protein